MFPDGVRMPGSWVAAPAGAAASRQSAASRRGNRRCTIREYFARAVTQAEVNAILNPALWTSAAIERAFFTGTCGMTTAQLLPDLTMSM